MTRIPFDRINWPTSLFLMITLLVAVTGVPVYLWHFGLDWFQAALFVIAKACRSPQTLLLI